MIPMRPLTEKEKAIILLLAKDFTADYNARSLSKKVGMSPRGALKALKFLEQYEIVKRKQIGKAIIYHLTFNEYGRRLVALCMFEDAQTNARRWVKEFKDFKEATALVLFGSVLRTSSYNDVDIMILIDLESHKKVSKLVHEKNNILVKPLHPVWQTRSDLEKNLRKPDPVILEILKTGVVLKGPEIIVEVIADVAGRK